MPGTRRRNHSGDTSVTHHDPKRLPTIADMIAGVSNLYENLTCRANDWADHAVPHTIAPLLVPSISAGKADGKIVNKQGSEISPPPPAMALMKPAKREQSEASIKVVSSMSLFHQ